MIRVGVVGLGVISRCYLAAIEQSAEFALAAVCDPDPAALSGRQVPSYRDYRTMLVDAGLDAGLDAVIVTAPNHLHAAVSRAALDAGLPVCVEKPLATTLADGFALVDRAQERGVALYTAFHRRHNNNVLTLLEKLRHAPPVESVRVRYLERIEDHAGADSWYLDTAQCGGGCIADNGPNAVDLVRQILGPVRFRGADIVRDADGVDRQATLFLDGATVELDWSFPGEVKDVEVLLADGTKLCADLLAGYASFKGSLWHEYVGVLREFAKAIRAGGAWRDHGLAALTLVEQAYGRLAHA